MITVSEIVKDQILEIVFFRNQQYEKNYTILSLRGKEISRGKIIGNLKRTCLYVGDLQKGTYNLQIDNCDIKSFIIP